jgi:hypothetical protein
MTLDEFFQHVETNGFYGYTPSPKDPLCDAWARKIGEEFDRVATDLPPSTFRHTVWLVFNWLYATLAHTGRYIASPQAMHIAGIDTPPEVISKACELLLASVE